MTVLIRITNPNGKHTRATHTERAHVKRQMSSSAGKKLENRLGGGKAKIKLLILPESTQYALVLLGILRKYFLILQGRLPDSPHRL